MTRNIVSVKDMVLDYIKKPIPSGMGIVTKSVPICFFGNLETARVATLSINPSFHEFEKGAHRLQDRNSLPGWPDDSDELSDAQANAVYDSCIEYFHKNPYTGWFGTEKKGLCQFLKQKYGASYYDGSLVGIDIVPWATTEIWGDLPENKRNVLVTEYEPYLKFILSNLDLDVIYINGSGVKDVVQKALGVGFTETLVTLPGAKAKIARYDAIYNGKTKLVGANLYFKYGSKKISEMFSITK